MKQGYMVEMKVNGESKWTTVQAVSAEDAKNMVEYHFAAKGMKCFVTAIYELNGEREWHSIEAVS